MLKDVVALILGGGVGTRLYPLTKLRARLCRVRRIRRARTATRGLMSSPDATPAMTARPRRLGGTLSIDWKLPLLMTAVLAAGLAAFLVFTYVTLARRSEQVVRDRFAYASRIIARSVVDGIQQRLTVTGGAARQPAVIQALGTFNAAGR